MTVTAIRLQNFMAFGEVEDENEGWIELRPISLLYGRNSSGKSAVIRALRLLKQSLHDVPLGSLFAYRVDDKLDIGSFLEMAHADLDYDENAYIYDPDAEDWTDKKSISFEFRCKVKPQELYYLVAEQEINRRAKAKIPIVYEWDSWVTLTLSYGWMPSNKGGGCAILVGFKLKSPWSYLEGENKTTIFEAVRLPMTSSLAELDGWWFSSDFLYEHWLEDWENFWAAIQVGITFNFLPKLLFGKEFRISPQTEPEDFKAVNNLLISTRKSITTFLENIEYVRPIRPEPKREYFLDDKQQKIWQLQGFGSYLNLLRNRLSSRQKERLDKWVNALLSPNDEKIKERYSVKPSPLINYADRALLTQLFIEDKRVGSLALLDVGFGISQVLPVLIQSILSDDDALVIVEQPELHLHASAQAQLADLFIEFAKQGKRILIETHSEHLMLRIRRRIAETSLDHLLPENKKRNEGFLLERQMFSLLFMMRDDNRSSVELIEVDHRGQLISPSRKFRAFFDDDFTELSALMRAKSQIIDIETNDTVDDRS